MDLPRDRRSYLITDLVSPGLMTEAEGLRREAGEQVEGLIEEKGLGPDEDPGRHNGDPDVVVDWERQSFYNSRNDDAGESRPKCDDGKQRHDQQAGNNKRRTALNRGRKASPRMVSHPSAHKCCGGVRKHGHGENGDCDPNGKDQDQ